MKRFMGLMLLIVLGAATGCGGGGVPVDGKVVDGNKPFTLAEGDSVTITMTSEDDKTTCTANVDKEGNFTAKTSTGQLVPPGKYKVTVLRYHLSTTPPALSKTPPPPQTPTSLETGEVWDVSSTNKTFTLDISKAKEPDKKKPGTGGPPSSKK